MSSQSMHDNIHIEDVGLYMTATQYDHLFLIEECEIDGVEYAICGRFSSHAHRGGNETLLRSKHNYWRYSGGNDGNYERQAKPVYLKHQIYLVRLDSVDTHELSRNVSFYNEAMKALSNSFNSIAVIKSDSMNNGKRYDNSYRNSWLMGELRNYFASF